MSQPQLSVTEIENLFKEWAPNGSAYQVRKDGERDDCLCVYYEGSAFQIDPELNVSTQLYGDGYEHSNSFTRLLERLLKAEFKLMLLSAAVQKFNDEVEECLIIGGNDENAQAV